MGTLKDLLTRTLRPGATVGERYQLQRRVGQGGFGEVWAALDLCQNIPVAIKMMPHQWVRVPEIQASLTQECVVLKTLAHPHICRVFDLVHDATYGPLLITELIDGVDCAAATRGGPVDTCWPLVLQTLTALSYLHGRGVLHLDIKPANVLVAKAGVKLIDFGLAAVAAPKPGAGTLAYMAPERIRGDGVDARADLYAVGILLYECLTGANPFHAPQPDAVRQKQLEWLPPPVSTIRHDCPAWVDTVMTQCLAKDPADRYPSAKAMLNELQLLLGDGVVQAAVGRGPVTASATAESFVGRQDIVEPLRMMWEHATEQPPAVHRMQLVGAMGMGKSRLLRELKFAAQLAGCRTVWCDAATDVTPAAMQPIAEALAAARPPIVLCLDDYDQWSSDPDAHVLVDLLDAMATHPHPPTPIWCLPTGKESMGALEGAALPSYHLQPFTEEELTAYVRAIAPVPDTQLAPFVERLRARTAGIPAHVAAIMQQLVTGGYFATPSGRWDAHLFADIVIDLPGPVAAGEATAAVADPDVLLPLCRHDRATGHAGRALAQLAVYWDPRGERSPSVAVAQDIALAIEAAECALTIGRPQAARLILECCMQRWPEERGPLCLWHGILWMAEREYGKALGSLHEGRVLATQRHDHVLTLKCQNHLARLALLQKYYDTAIAEFRSTRDAMRALPVEAARQIVNNELGHALLLAGHWQEATSVLTEEIAHCRSAGAAHRMLRAQLWRAECRRLLGEWEPAHTDTEAVMQAARRHQFLQLLAETYNAMGMLYCQRGTAADGLAHYERALALAYTVHDLATVTIVTTNIGLERLRGGEPAKARHAFETVLAFLDQQAFPTIIERAAVPARIGLAEIARQERRYAEALSHLTTAETLAIQHQLLSQYQFPIVLTQAEIARDQRDGKTAQTLGLRAQSFARSPAEQTAWQVFMDSLASL